MLSEDVDDAVPEDVAVDFEPEFEGQFGEEWGIGLRICGLGRIVFEEAAEGTCEVAFSRESEGCRDVGGGGCLLIWRRGFFC